MSDVLVLAAFAIVMALMLLVAWQVGALRTNASSSHYDMEIDTVWDPIRELGPQAIVTEGPTDWPRTASSQGVIGRRLNRGA